MAVIMRQKRLELRRWRNIWRTNSNFRGHSLITRADCDPLKRWSVEGRQLIEVWVQDFGSTPHPDPRHELARSSNRSLLGKAALKTHAVQTRTLHPLTRPEARSVWSASDFELNLGARSNG